MKLPLWASALCATLLVQVVSSFAAAAIPLLGPLLMHRWNLPPESIGYVSAMVSIGICWCLACGNPMLDHHGPIRTLQIGLVSIGLGTLLLTLTNSLLGFVGAICGPVAISLIANLTGNLQVPLALVAIQAAAFGLFAIWRQIQAK